LEGRTGLIISFETPVLEIFVTWILNAYMILSLVDGVMGMFTAGFWSGASLLAAAFLSLAIVGGLKAAFFRYESDHRLGYLAVSLVAFALIAWLSQKFQFALFGLNMPGWQWCAIGASVSALYSSIDRDSRWTGEN
jgi:hypothetical protein